MIVVSNSYGQKICGITDNNLIILPAGEIHLPSRINESLEYYKRHYHCLSEFIVINAKLNSSKMVMALLHLCKLCNNLFIPFYLEIPYLPYGRSDREAAGNGVCGVEVFLNQIKNVSGEMLKDISTLVPHSEATTKFLKDIFDSYGIEEYTGWFNKVLRVHDRTYLIKLLSNTRNIQVIPDKGATKYRLDLLFREVVYFEKVRNSETGKITGLSICHDKNVLDSDDYREATFIITDDICDGGGTFVLVAKKLREKFGSNIKIVLATPHVILKAYDLESFEAGEKPLEGIDLVICSDSCRTFPKEISDNNYYQFGNPIIFQVENY
jgi:ribose-phosphate pyrophosphokinase